MTNGTVLLILIERPLHSETVATMLIWLHLHYKAKELNFNFTSERILISLSQYLYLSFLDIFWIDISLILLH